MTRLPGHRHEPRAGSALPKVTSMVLRMVRLVPSIPSVAGVALVLAYQSMIRPFLAGSCRHHPNCSEYAIQALRIHGLLRGGRLVAGRLLRCRPFAVAGYDPVPPASPRPAET